MITFLRWWFLITATLLYVAAVFGLCYWAGLRSPWIGGVVTAAILAWNAVVPAWVMRKGNL